MLSPSFHNDAAPPVNDPGHVVIVGAGIVGISAAFFLSRRGVRVTVLEAASPAAGASGASDGAVSVASKRPGLMMQLGLAGIATYRALASGGVLAGEFRERPTFIIASNAAEAEVLAEHAAALAGAGVTVRLLARAEITGLLPMVSDEVVALARVEGEGHAIGYRVVERLARAGRFTLRRSAPVDGFVRDKTGRVTAVSTGQGGLVAADAVLVAAGNGSERLLGLSGALIPRKGQLLLTERAAGRLAAPAGPLMSSRYLLSKGAAKGGPADAARSFGLVIDPLATGQFLIGGTREDGVTHTDNDLAAVRHILAEAVALMPDLARLRLLRAFSGIRTATVDRLPIVGAVPGAENLFVATGFEGDGICLGPFMGELMHRLICGEPAAVDVNALSPARFTPRAA